MSILQEYEEIKNEIGEDKYNAISEYLEEICPESKRIEYTNEIIELNGLNVEEWLSKRKEIENKYKIVLLSDVLYVREEWEKFDKWYNNKTKNTRTLADGTKVLDLGYRNEQPVALVQRPNQEYVIGFNYKITDNKIEWAYGYYYDKNIDKAKADFKKVLSGGNLSHTFDKEKKEAR